MWQKGLKVKVKMFSVLIPMFVEVTEKKTGRVFFCAPPPVESIRLYSPYVTVTSKAVFLFYFATLEYFLCPGVLFFELCCWELIMTFWSSIVRRYTSTFITVLFLYFQTRRNRVRGGSSPPPRFLLNYIFYLL